MAKAQHNAYIKQMHRYDALMTGRSWWGHLFEIVEKAHELT